MQPTKVDNRQEDVFRGRLSNELNPKHEMMILSRLISWDSLEVEFADLYQSERNVGGQPPKPIRLMIGILLLQHLHNLSDEQVVRTSQLIHLLLPASERGLELIEWKRFFL
jgi:transposase, IS5 family